MVGTTIAAGENHEGKMGLETTPAIKRIGNLGESAKLPLENSAS
jgi:hypothetical protein